MRRDILFIHGMFLNPVSWEEWQAWYEARGYHCSAPAWPLHEGDPAALRAHLPAGIGTLSLEAVVEAMTVASATLEDPILIGHSVGGLVAQILASRGIGSAVHDRRRRHRGDPSGLRSQRRQSSGRQSILNCLRMWAAAAAPAVPGSSSSTSSAQ